MAAQMTEDLTKFRDEAAQERREDSAAALSCKSPYQI